MKIGLLIIATNRYIQFVKPLWDSVKKNFMPGHEISMFVFTNMPETPEGTIRIQHEHTPWPGPTLLRYHCFTKNKQALEGMDFLYYLDADMLVVGEVGDEVMGYSIATLHPGFFDKPKNMFSYEKRPQSSCYVAPHQGENYYAGGFNGGTFSGYMTMAEVCRDMIDADGRKGIIPVWHDESAMNRYFIDHPPSIILTPSYCYQEGRTLPFRQKILALNKNHAQMRS